MRKTLESLSDRVLSLFVAKVDVGAACPRDSWYEHCYCRERSDFRKYCWLDSRTCQPVCGPCQVFKSCI
ncbi:hypothetical protein [Actinophytocola sp.]|uniref:hypothetical protein n=1 Tax=Actinophytocola sp. TaxID=1872138 RepID=UPI002ED38994